ncbi:MAG TPA: HEAT repeat domain-containing protein [Caulobacteraceae bacterium]|jgi:HEAT repeat protein|nr:HEAT repeat domain-containing protein [Caulobacteraceae bacterium]
MPLIRKDSSAPTAPQAATAPSDAHGLTQGSASERRATARALGANPDEIEALGQALASEADPHVRGAIFTSLVRHAGPASVAAILPHLRSDDANLRTGALDALRAMPQAVEPQLSALLGDADSDVRLLACEIVRGLSPNYGTPLLTALLERESEVNVCAAAIEVLAETGDADALPALSRCAERFANEPFLVFSVKVASDRIRAEGSAEISDGAGASG